MENLNRSRYSHLREGKVGEKVETWPGRRQNRVFVSYGHPSVRIFMPVGTTLLFDKDIESRAYGPINGPIGTMQSREVTVCRLSGDEHPFRIAVLAKDAKDPISMDYVRARQTATIINLPEGRRS